MTRLMKTLLVWLLCPLLLSGCWDIKQLQDVDYITAIGFDYIDDKYIIYVQMIDFSSVAKSETGRPTQPVPVWIGKAKGDTPVIAFNELYRSSQLRVFYGQISSIILGENLLKRGLGDIDDFFTRYYELRYTPWIFGTKLPIDKLLAVTPFFNQSPIMSLMHQPKESYYQESLITPITIRQFITDAKEPGKTSVLPTISITDQNWLRDKDPHQMLIIDGAFLVKQYTYKGWAGVKSIPGLRWMDPSTNRSPLIIRSDGDFKVALSLEKPKVRIKPQVQNENITYNLHVDVAGYVTEFRHKLPELELEQKAQEQVRKEIQKTFDEGMRFNADIFSLEHELYRQNNREWKKLKEQERLGLNKDSLGTVDVVVRMNHTGKIKY